MVALSGKLRMGGGNLAPIVTRSFGGVDPQLSASSPTTWVDAPLGTDSADRIIVIVVGCRTASADTPVATSVTVKGVSATLLVNAIGNSRAQVDIWWVVTTGTAEDIVCTFHKSNAGGKIVWVYSIYGADSTVRDTGTVSVANDTTAGIDIDVVAGGVVIAATYSDTAWGTPLLAFSGITKDNSEQSGTSRGESGVASNEVLVSDLTLDIDVTFNATQKIGLCAVSWQPA